MLAQNFKSAAELDLTEPQAAAVVSSPERAVEIPEGVYFSADSSNFYHVDTKRGCGNDFYRIWKDYWRAFPQREAAAVSSKMHREVE